MSSVLISRNGGAQTRIGGAQAAKESMLFQQLYFFRFLLRTAQQICTTNYQ
jgi:hypothetical protein